MSRGLWFVAGAGAGVYAMVRGRRAAEALTVDGLRDRWHGLAHGARLLREEVAQGQAEKETELRQRLGLVPHGLSGTGGRHRAALPSEAPGRDTDHRATTADEEGTP
jgi:hypothetical protein